MALTAQELEFQAFALAALPGWFPQTDEFIAGCAKMFGSVKALSDYWFGQTLISTATGASSTTPDWLGQHARDRNTSRQLNESNEALRDRLRNTPEAVTPASLVIAANAILAADGVVGTAALVELPRDGAHGGRFAAMTGTGGTFTAPDGDGIMGFAPTIGWPTPPVDSTGTGHPWPSWHLAITGAAHAANNGDTDIDGTPGPDIVGNSARYSNPGGVAGVDPTVTWSADAIPFAPHTSVGFSRAYSRRGYRSGRLSGTLILILPYGSTAGTEASMREMLRQKKAAGFKSKIERRLNP